MREKMPIIRKVIAIGDSRGISLPKSWIDYLERQTGTKLKEVAIEVDGILRVSPIINTQEHK
jgi:hypothetical protein